MACSSLVKARLQSIDCACDPSKLVKTSKKRATMALLTYSSSVQGLLQSAKNYPDKLQRSVVIIFLARHCSDGRKVHFR